MARIPEELRRRIKGALGVDPPDDLEGEALLSYIEEVRKTSPALYRELVDTLQEQAVLEVGKAPSVKTPRPLNLARFLYKKDAEGNWVFDRMRGIALTLVAVLMVIFLIQFLMAPRGRHAPAKAGGPPAQQAAQSPAQEASAPLPPQEAKQEGAQAQEETKAQVPTPPQTDTPQGEGAKETSAPPPPPPNPTPDLPPPPDYEGGAQAVTGITTLYRRQKPEEGSNWAPVRPPAQGGQSTSAGGPFLIQVHGGKTENTSSQNSSWISLSAKGKGQTAPSWQRVEKSAPAQGEASAWIRREAPKEGGAPLLIAPQKAPTPQGEMVTIYKRSEKKEGSWTAFDGAPSTVTGQAPPSAPKEGQGQTAPPSQNPQAPSANPEEQKPTPPPEGSGKEEKAP